MRSRIAGVLTLLSSNVKAAAYVGLLAHGLTDKELARLAVVVRRSFQARRRRLGPCSTSAKEVNPRCGDSLGPLAETNSGW